MTTDTLTPPARKVDYELVFKMMPGMCLVLDADFTIIAQNEEHAAATLSFAKGVVGQNLFAAFPDNPNHSAADGVALVRASLVKVLKTRAPDIMPVIRYDVQPDFGAFQERYWAITNTPILDAQGYVRWIINRADEVTELERFRKEVIALRAGPKA